MINQYHWTNHAHYKMRFYRLSGQMVKSVINRPMRIEEGIALNTIAYMKRSGSKKKPHEIWVMVAAQNKKSNIKNQNDNSKYKNQEYRTKSIDVYLKSNVNCHRSSVPRIISAWRYPGITKPGKSLPKEILTEIDEAI